MNDLIKKPWYQKKTVVILWIVFFFPVGLYGLWKGDIFTKIIKITITAFFILLMVFMPKSNNVVEFDLKKEKEDQLIHIAFDAERTIKENMKDPSSFELIDRDYKFLSDTVYEINITYSGTNSFGGRIQNKYLKMGILKFDAKDTTFTNTVKFER